MGTIEDKRKYQKTILNSVVSHTIFEIEILTGESDIILDAAEQVIIEHVAR